MSTTWTSLDSFQFLLKHMDANRRFEIYNRCPSLRDLEKSVSLNINHLAFGETSVVVNDTIYKIGIIRKYNIGEAPEYVVDSNDSGGLPFEVDNYGIKNDLDALTALPGDVRIEPRGWRRTPEENFYVRFLENQIQRYEVQLAQEREIKRNRSSRTADDLEIKIEVARGKVFDYQSRRNNIPPNFEHFLQLTKSKIRKQDQKTIEKYTHNKTFSEAMKQLTTVMFSERSSPINVRKFELNYGLSVIRLPIGLKFKIEQLMFSQVVGATLEILAPVLHESSYPLKKLVVYRLSRDEITNPIIRTVRILKITSILESIPSYISEITSPVIHLTLSRFSEQILEELIAKCFELHRPIGTEFIFNFLEEPHFEMEDTLKRLNGVPIDDENVIIPMSDDTQLKVTYGPFPEFAPDSKWAFRLFNEAIEN